MNRRLRRAEARGRERRAAFLRSDHTARLCALASAREARATPACPAPAQQPEPEAEPLFALRFKAGTKAAVPLAERGDLPAVRLVLARFLRCLHSGGATLRRTCAGARVATSHYRAWQVYEIIHAGSTSLVWSESA